MRARWRAAAFVMAATVWPLLACEAILGIEESTSTANNVDGAPGAEAGSVDVDAGGLPADSGSESSSPGTGSLCDEGDAYFLCEGFEHGWGTWAVEVYGDGGLTIDDAGARVGQGYLTARIGGPDVSKPATSFLAKSAPLPDTFTIRFFLRVESVNPGSTFGILYLYRSDDHPVELILASGPRLALSLVDAGVTNATASYPLGPWNCIEWEISPGKMSVRQNGLHVIDDAPLDAPGATDFEIGLRSSTAPSGSNLHIDELVMAAESPGCAR